MVSFWSGSKKQKELSMVSGFTFQSEVIAIYDTKTRGTICESTPSSLVLLTTINPHPTFPRDMLPKAFRSFKNNDPWTRVSNPPFRLTLKMVRTRLGPLARLSHYFQRRGEVHLLQLPFLNFEFMLHIEKIKKKGSYQNSKERNGTNWRVWEQSTGGEGVNKRKQRQTDPI